MQTKLIYIAEDGTEFRNEHDCFLYETEQMWAEIKEDVIFFVHDKKLDTDIITMCEDCTAFFCKTYKAAEILDDIFSFAINWSPLSDMGDYEEGLYFYSGYRNCWLHYETEIQYLNDEAKGYLDEIAEGEN